MFDIGFWEMGLIGVVALLVIGPERLPGVARTVGMWIGRMRGFVGSVQADINQELGKADQLKALLEEQSKIQSAHEIIEETSNQIRDSLSVSSAKPDYQLKAEPVVASTPEVAAEMPAEPATTPSPKPTQASRAVAAGSRSPLSAAAAAAAIPAKATADARKEPAKADDVKHDQSA